MRDEMEPPVAAADLRQGPVAFEICSFVPRLFDVRRPETRTGNPHAQNPVLLHASGAENSPADLITRSLSTARRARCIKVSTLLRAVLGPPVLNC